MKVAAVLVCALSFAYGRNLRQNENGCSIDPNIEKLITHEHCNKFYQCTHGNLVEHTCPLNLLFNIYKQECDFPQSVECGNRIIVEPSPEKVDNDCNYNEDTNDAITCKFKPGEAPAICSQRESDGILIAHENCNQFYKCEHGLPVVIICPGNLLYNPNTEVCDWPDVVECGMRIILDPSESNCDNDTGDNGDTAGIDGSCNCNPGEASAICSHRESDGVLVAHENCNQFYKCANGLPVTISCPGNLLYNPYKEVCDWPNVVECGERIIPDPNESDNGSVDNGTDDNENGGEVDSGTGGSGGSCNCRPGEAPTICSQRESDGVLVAHENCNQFYKCANGLPVTISCPGNLLYNPYKEVCDWPNAVECGERIIPDPNESDNGSVDNGTDDNENGGEDDSGTGGSGGSCNCRPGEAPTICSQRESDGVLVAHENCNQFYKCANGLPVTISCPGNLLYNPYKEICDWPNVVECGERIIPDPNESDNGSVDNGTDDNENGGEVDSGTGGSGGSCNCRPGEAPTICSQRESDGVLVAHENCNQFYKCANGLPVTISCPGNLLYNPYKEICDWPNVVECGERIIPDPNESDNGSVDNGTDDNENGGEVDSGTGGSGGSCNCRPGEAPTICSQRESDGVLVAHENCNQFYKCANGLPVTISCPGNLLYNPYKEICDWPNVVECGERIIPDPNESDNGSVDNGTDDNENGGEVDSGTGGSGGSCNCRPGEAPTICSQRESDGVLVAHENCNQFYKCANGLPVTISCPGNLLYNPYKEICDWPNVVECGERIIPDPNESDNGSVDNGTDDNENGGEVDSGTGGSGGSCNCRPGEAPTICSQRESDGVLVAHENCNQFYKCANGLPVTISCPGNLLYNPYKEVCDWPNAVECGERIIPDPNESDNGSVDNGTDDNENGGEVDSGTGGSGGSCNCRPGEAPTICSQRESDGVLVAHENCNQFYKCANGLPVTISCPGNLLYNPYKEICDWPNVVECGERIIPDPNESDNGSVDNGTDDNENGGEVDSGTGGSGGSCNCRPGEAPTICSQRESDGVLVAHENCNQFYKCANGLPVTISCPGNLLYNPYKEICDWPNVVECGERIIPDPNESDNGSVDNGTDDNENGGEVDSGTGGSGGSCNCRPGEAPTICSQRESDGVLVAHENCNQFYKCANGLPVTISCPGNLLYNPYKEVCDWPNVVECGERIIPDPNESDNGSVDNGTDNNENGGEVDSGTGGSGGSCNCRPGEAPTICSQRESDGVLVSHENCNQFYKCANGLPVTISCPGNLLYNPYKEICDWPNVVECGERIIPDPNESDNGSVDNGTDDNENGGEVDSGTGGSGGSCNCRPGEAPTICSQRESDGVLVAHENCNQFYKCANGLPVTISCPGNLLYNPYKEVCDWPNVVECGERIIPDPNESDNGSVDNGTDNNENGGEVDSGTGGSGGSCNCRPGEAPTICSQRESDGVLVSHENCNQFYKCANGLPVTISCPGNLLYNPYKEICDWPNVVECGERIIPDPNESDNGSVDNGTDDNENGGEVDSGTGGSGGSCNCRPGEAPTICSQRESDGVLVAHENCNQFYKCANGLPVTISCPGNLLYNPYKEVCDWPNVVECGERIIPDPNESDNGSVDNGTDNNENGGEVDSGTGGSGGSCNCRPGEAPTICSQRESDGVLVAHENCNQFYKCANGLPVTINCPGNLLYNPYKEVCDWPNAVECGERIIPDPNESDNGSVDNGTDDNENGGEDDSGTGGSGGSCNCRPGEAPTICSQRESDGVLVAHENCNQFYKCANGLPVTINCPGNLLYNPYKEVCDWPNAVECGERIIPDPNESDNGSVDNGKDDNENGGEDDSGTGGSGGSCNCRPGEAPTICSQRESDGVLVAHENCNQFYKCANGLPVTISCPGNLLYNPYKEICDWPNVVECGERIIPDPNESDNGSVDNGTDDNENGGEVDSGTGGSGGSCNCRPGEAPTICGQRESDGVLVAHENCNQFYKCANGLPATISCPGNLLYNPYKEVCDWHNAVECGERIIPDFTDSDNGTVDIDENGNEVDGDNGSGSGSCNCNPGEAPFICNHLRSDGVLVAHENCNQFYKCANTVPITISCPGSLLYDPFKEECDWPSEVECGERIVPDPSDNENDTDDNGNGVGDNGSGGNNDLCNCNPRQARSICKHQKSDGVLVAHENCNQFYQCTHGIPISMKCPGNLLYNPYKEKCSWPNEIECGERHLPLPLL